MELFIELYEANIALIVNAVDRIRNEIKEGKRKSTVYIPSGKLASLETCYSILEVEEPELMEMMEEYEDLYLGSSSPS